MRHILHDGNHKVVADHRTGENLNKPLKEFKKELKDKTKRARNE